MRTRKVVSVILGAFVLVGCGGGGGGSSISPTISQVQTQEPSAPKPVEPRTDLPVAPTPPVPTPVPTVTEPTEEQVKELVRRLASVKDDSGQYRLWRWVSKDVKVLVAPSAVGELQAVKDGCKLWENENLGFSFDVQLADREYGSERNFPPPGSVAVVGDWSNPSPYAAGAQEWNQATIGPMAPYSLDTGVIMLWHRDGITALTIGHELWHILVSREEYANDLAFEPLTKAAVRFIWSRQPGDVI